MISKLLELFSTPSPAEQEWRKTLELHKRVQALYAGSSVARLDPPRLAGDLAEAAFAKAGHPAVNFFHPLVAATAETILLLIRREPLFVQPPALDVLVPLPFDEDVALRARLRTQERFLLSAHAHFETWKGCIVSILAALLSSVPRSCDPAGDAEAGPFSVALCDLLDDPGTTLTCLILPFTADGPLHDANLLEPVRLALSHNILQASGITSRTSQKSVVFPRKAAGKGPQQLVADYFVGTPFTHLLTAAIPFQIPLAARFEHTHIVGGSGHGKTQLLQQLILGDLAALQEGKGSLVIIDSQGDMIRTITRLAEFSPDAPNSLAARLVLIDPNDIEHPPALNLFDFGLDRLGRYDALEREKLVNGAIALYEYMFGALLGAELTQRQGVIFRYLARLMMVVRGATIHTLREFMEDPESVRPHLPALDATSRHFFTSQFLTDTFDDTRQQILTRLWGILSNSVLERMFSNERNRVNLFEAMNSGSVILVNTAKDLLKQEGCEILGRFFIAMITHATQERAIIPANRRRATFLYVDEAQDYFDRSIEQLLNQARKYRVGLILAHQNLGQFEPGLLASIMASTAIKLAGGVSAKDAAAFAKEMRCEPDFLQGVRKRRDRTEFACSIRNLTENPIRLTVPFGAMEQRPCMSDEEHAELVARNRARYCAGAEDTAAPTFATAKPASTGSFELGAHEPL